MTYHDYKQKVRDGFDERFGHMFSDSMSETFMPDLAEKKEIETYYEKAMDNLLVEVEGVPDNFKPHKKDCCELWGGCSCVSCECGFLNAAQMKERDRTRFKGEDSKV